MGRQREEDPTWREHAACQGEDLDVFFPERGESVEPARAICMGCAVFDDCYRVGLRERHGIWAGTSERDRRRIRRRLGIVLRDEVEDTEDEIEEDIAS